MRILIKLIACFLLLAIDVSAQNRSADALVEYRAGNYERAIQICRDDISVNPNSLESHVVICWALSRLNRYEEALRFARAGRVINRHDARIVEILGEIHYFQGLNDEALQYFQEYISLVQEGQRIEMIYYYMGEIYIRQGKFRHADISFTTAVHWVPGNAEWWVRLAYARENSGDLSSALEAYERALSLNPQMTDARRGLDRIRSALGGTAQSGATSVAVTPAAPVPAARPGLTGVVTINNADPRAGDSITAAFTGNGTGTQTWQWFVDDTVIAGANNNTYVAGVTDVGRTLRARVSYSNQSGNITSAATRAVSRVSLSGNVTISSMSPKVGEIITAAFTGNGNGSASWQWLAGDAVIEGAVNSNYTVERSDLTKTLSARVSYSNQSGSITSAATGAVTRAGLTGAVTLDIMSPKVGNVITASYSGNGTGIVTWQWLSNNNVIRGATNSTYLVTSSDIRRTLRARVTFADQDDSVISAATNNVIR